MIGSGVINNTPINSEPLNASDYNLIVANAVIPIQVNVRETGYINTQPIGIPLINGPLPSEIVLVQNYVLTVNNAVIALASSSPAITMTHLLVVNNARIPLTADHIRLAKSQGGALLITVTTPDSDVYRYSFEGVKA